MGYGGCVYKKRGNVGTGAGDGDGNHGMDAMVEKGFLARRELATPSLCLCAVRRGY
jgi:hypothetical protein